jgi:hypothetical protein
MPGLCIAPQNVYTKDILLSKWMERVVPKEKNRKGDRKKKAGKKGSQLAIRIEKSERDAFVDLCDRLDTSAAREIRRFMREFVAAHGASVPEDGPAEPADTAPPAPVEAPPAPVKARKPRATRAKTAAETAEAAPPAPSRGRRARATTKPG